MGHTVLAQYYTSTKIMSKRDDAEWRSIENNKHLQNEFVLTSYQAT